MDKYRIVGPIYDLLGKLYSGDQIKACKLAMIRPDIVQPDDHILFVGAGHGVDAIEAAKLGGQVTVVDISPTMMRRFTQNVRHELEDVQSKIQTYERDILKLDTFEHYDTVVINFFLNVFEREKMELLLQHLIKLCRPKGSLIIGDFSPVDGRLIDKAIQNVYWYTAAIAFFAMAGNAVHPIYDYQSLLRTAQFDIREVRDFRVMGRTRYQSLRAEKTG